MSDSIPLAELLFFFYLYLNLPSATVFHKDIYNAFTRSFCLYFSSCPYRRHFFIAAQAAELFGMVLEELFFPHDIQESFRTQCYSTAVFSV